MSRIAIIGTGIAGMGCAHLLQAEHDITLFDPNSYIGGHTNTVTVSEGDRSIPIDTGFMVYNEVTYPNLTRLFRELNVPAKKTDMSFSVQHLSSGLEFSGSSMNHLFAQRRNLLRPRFWKLLMQINRFNEEAVEALKSGSAADVSLEDYVCERRYGADFFDHYLVPMSSAVWSTPPEKMLQFPAATLLRFFHNHGFLGLHTQHQWWTVDGGAQEYVRRITKPFSDRIRLNCGVRSVEQSTAGATVVTDHDERLEFDHAILACHADQALRLLSNPGVNQNRLLASFKYQPNVATLHTDASVMPQKKLAWSAWNYRIFQDSEQRQSTSTIYWMNCLQDVSDQQDYFVSVNGEREIDAGKILKQMEYEHPLFDLEATRAQDELFQLNCESPGQPVYFCGSYFRYGFHEDAYTSAINLCRTILKQEPVHA
ncbi:MAG: putative NAD/FAD-binding protein [Limisphaerales bacterium]